MSSDDLRTLYQEIILDQARTPYGRGITEGWSARVHEVNPVCGDEIDLAPTLAGDTIATVRWEGHGCAISQASASLLAGLVEGTQVDDTRQLIEEFRTALRSRGAVELDEERFGEAVALGGVARYVARVKCAMLAWVALDHALDAAAV